MFRYFHQSLYLLSADDTCVCDDTKARRMSINISSSIIIFNLIIVLITMMIFMMQRSGSVSSLCGDGLGLPDHPFLLQCDVIPGNILNKYPPMWYPAISSTRICHHILLQYPKSGVDIITIQFPNWGPSSSSAPEMISMANNLFLTINQQEKSYLANFFFYILSEQLFNIHDSSYYCAVV